MKLIGKYTAKGIVTESETEGSIPQKIPLYDANPSTAYRVVGFHIWGASYGSSTQPDCIGKLSKNDDGVTSASNFMRADDNNQLAWGWFNATTDSGGDSMESIIDPDNLVVEDLYVYARSNSGSTSSINYMVLLEKYEISEWQGALAMARDRAQGDL
tara:strand:+ start:1513 stop:1983 length:471 start_codon:yes stop_codon:yes gene_type:complete